MWTVLSTLTEPWFVIPWFVVGLTGAWYVSHDIARGNAAPVMRWAWPVGALFFSVIGLALYFTTRRTHERSLIRQVISAAILCVAGDGLGIVIAMVIARLAGMSFWQEFWFEYAVGFGFGWLAFHRQAMSAMTVDKAGGLVRAFRVEFFSIMTVMGGMGAVMTYVTASVAGAQPGPFTYAFWGFIVLGLFVGYVFTLPVAWIMLTIGWKPGTGAQPDHRRAGLATRAVLVSALLGLGAAALVLPAWLTELRERTPVASRAPRVDGEAHDLAGATAARPKLLREGLRESLSVAASSLVARHRREATTALDAARRLAEVLVRAAPWDSSRTLLEKIEATRRGLQMGSRADAMDNLTEARTLAARSEDLEIFAPPPSALAYDGVPLLNAEGTIIGAITGNDGSRIQLALGAGRPFWGFLDVGNRRVMSLPKDAVVFGPRFALGESYAVLPTMQ